MHNYKSETYIVQRAVVLTAVLVCLTIYVMINVLQHWLRPYQLDKLAVVA